MEEEKSFIKLLFCVHCEEKFASYFPSFDSWVWWKWSKKCSTSLNSLIQVNKSRDEMNWGKVTRKQKEKLSWNKLNNKSIFIGIDFYFKLRLIIIPRGLKKLMEENVYSSVPNLGFVKEMRDIYYAMSGTTVDSFRVKKNFHKLYPQVNHSRSGTRRRREKLWFNIFQSASSTLNWFSEKQTRLSPSLLSFVENLLLMWSLATKLC